MKITRNLAAALRCFQSSGNSRILWIDSICINQSDIQEKNQQVRLMGEIYKKARRVLIWLGEKDHAGEDTTKAFECMDLMIHRVWPRKNEFFLWLNVRKHVLRTRINSQVENTENVTAKFNIPAPGSIEFKSLDRLLHRPWFRRAWTFQESFNAQDRVFYCGDYEIGGEPMARVVDMVWSLYEATYDKGYMHVEDFHCISMVLGKQFYDRETDSTPAAKLRLLLGHRRGSECKDPRDLIFALVGVGTVGAVIEVDYNHSLERVFATATSRIMVRTGHLNILQDVYHATAPTSLPSWVPDWRLSVESRGVNAVVSSYPFTSRTYSSSGTSKALPELSECSREILAHGIYWDEIATTTTCSHPNAHEWVREQFPKAPVYDQWYEATKEALDVAVLRTQCSDLKIFDPLRKSARWDSQSFQDFHNVSRPKGGLLPAFTREFHRNLNGRLLAVTKKYRIGHIPTWSQPGDTVAFLLGGEVPVILRRDPDDGKYTFVGECYMHGFMDGEALIEARRQAQPDYDHSDTSWLNRLHEEDLPFPTTAFTIK